MPTNTKKAISIRIEDSFFDKNIVERVKELLVDAATACRINGQPVTRINVGAMLGIHRSRVTRICERLDMTYIFKPEPKAEKEATK